MSVDQSLTFDEGGRSGPIPGGAVATSSEPQAPSAWGVILDALKTTQGKMVAIALFAYLFAFHDFIFTNIAESFKDDSYFNDASLIPLLIGFLIYNNRENLSKIPIKSFWPAIIPLLPIVGLASLSSAADYIRPDAYMFWAGLVLFTIALLGWRMAWALKYPLFYTFFFLPLGGQRYDALTVNLQHLSTDISHQIISLCGFSNTVFPPNEIVIGSYDLYLASACSGLHLIIAVTAFMFFFISIGNLAWWKNAFLLFLIVPFSLLMNGIRVSMIGMVGAQFGDKAGATFHDYSGYIMILLGFYILMKITSLLGWKG